MDEMNRLSLEGREHAVRDDALIPASSRSGMPTGRCMGPTRFGEAAESRRHPCRASHSRALDKTSGVARRAPWQGGAHHNARYLGAMSNGPGPAGVQSRAAQPVVGASAWRRIRCL